MLHTARWARSWSVARAAMSALILAAIVAQAIRTIGGAMDAGRDVATTITNFFSFFTILSNVGAVIVLAWAAVWFWMRGRGEASEPRGLSLMLASVSTYMIVTGIVYNTLLRGIDLPQGTTVWWSNEILHLVGPLFLLADVFLAPRRRCLGWGAIGVVLIFPLVWVAYTLLRGEHVVNPMNSEHWWYPYPFLNPHLGSWSSVWFWVVVIAVALGVVAAGVVWVSRIRGRVRQPEPALASS